MAARASQAGASRPGPASTSTPLPSVRASATASPLPSVRESAASAPSRPTEAGKEDSGIVNLASIKSAATAEEKAAAEKAKPGTEGIFEDDEKKPAAGAKVVPIASAKSASAVEAQKKKGSSGVVVGGVIAILGLAAAFAITKVNKPATPPPAPVAAEVKQAAPEVKAETAPQVAATNAPVAQASAEPSPSAVASAEPSKVATATQSGSPGAGGPAPGGAAPTEAAPPSEAATASKPAGNPASDTPSKPGDLKGAMAQAVGSDGSSKAAATSDNAEPASGPRNQNIPEQPPQGAVQASIRAVAGEAKSCVAGADDISHANVTSAPTFARGRSTPWPPASRAGAG
jgi:hypothetical protein